MFKWSVCGYCNAYIFVKKSITINKAGQHAEARKSDKRDM